MSKIKKKIDKLVCDIVNSVAQTSFGKTGTEISSEEMSRLCRKAGAEGIVMLKNNDNVLPLSKDRVVSVFGRVQRDYFYVGYGSGGDIKPPYKVNLIDGMKNNEDITLNEELVSEYENWCVNNPVSDGFWGHWPMCYEEMPVTLEFVKKHAAKSDTAVVVIGRAAGEDRENTLTKGSYYLTNEEEKLLDCVCEAFSKVVVLLDCGSIMDMEWTLKYGDKISSILYVWQSGMESGNAVADVLSGKASPCGKLSDTIAVNYNCYPSSKFFGNKKYNEYTEDIYVGYRFFETFAKNQVLYPFGFGLSYTDFEIKVSQTRQTGDIITAFVNVKNIGDKFSGKEVVEVYLNSPQGALGKSLRTLVTYGKTKLLAPGEEEKIKLSFDLKDFASYDDSGITGYKNAYVLEKGDYEIYIGTDVRSATLAKKVNVPVLRVVSQLTQAATPSAEYPFERLRTKVLDDGRILPVTEATPLRTTSLRERILKNIPKDIPQTGDLGYKLSDVKNGRITMEEFVAQLSFDELEAISRGDYTMNSPLGAEGNAGAIGGVLPSLREKGVPAVITTDGPSGIRLACSCSLLPNGVALACTFDYELVKELYTELSKEMKDRGSDILLAPGMNIHRSPLCGRNFEYFSEDPVLSGLTGAAIVEGVQSSGLSACPKHYACNNQETNRTHNDSRVSERALREIYLKGFEIMVKKSNPKNIMTSYNKINGVWGHYNYDLVTTILRGEWGYEGSVMTDWWMRSSKSPEFPKVSDQGYRVRAQVDVLMPGGPHVVKNRKADGTLLASHKAKKDAVTLGEMQICAMHVLKMAMGFIKD